MTMNLVHLASLRELSRRGTFAAAADALGYTPGAVSQHLTALEAEVGTPLLDRVGRRVVLTDAGRVLAEHAEALLAAEQQARHDVARSGAEVAGPLVLGLWGSSAAALLPPLLALAAERHPDLVVTSREVAVDAAARAVRLGDVDVAFGLDYPDDPIPRERDTAVTPLLREAFWVAAARRPRRSGPVALADLADEPWVLPDPATVMGRAVRVAFRQAGVEPRVAHEVNDSAASLALAAQGVGLTVATDLMHRLARVPGLTRVHLRDDFHRDLVLVAPSGARAGRTTAAAVALAADAVELLQRASP